MITEKKYKDLAIALQYVFWQAKRQHTKYHHKFGQSGNRRHSVFVVRACFLSVYITTVLITYIGTSREKKQQTTLFYPL